MAITMNTGILGGVFNPIHMGHLAVAERASNALKLNEVLFIPVGKPCFSEKEESILPSEHRVEMVRLAIESNTLFKLSTIEIERPGRSYSVDTLEDLRRQYGHDKRYFFIMGEDTLSTLPYWKSPNRLMKQCQLVVINRSDSPPSDRTMLERDLPGISLRLILLAMPPVDISSTDIRRRVARGKSISGLVPPQVEEYIREHGLYR